MRGGVGGSVGIISLFLPKYKVLIKLYFGAVE